MSIVKDMLVSDVDPVLVVEQTWSMENKKYS